jgi:IMP dehydrogenase
MTKVIHEPNNCPFLTYDDVQIIPRHSGIASRSKVSIETTLVKGIDIQHPLLPANMDSISCVDMIKASKKSICFYHRFNHIRDVMEDITRSLYDVSPIGFSIGTGSVNITYAKHILERYRGLLRSDNKIVFLLDVAHGHHENVRLTLREYYQDPDLAKIPIIAGNVANAEGAKFLIEHGAWGIKVGIGNGSMCSTRIQTGVGIPQFSAVLHCRAMIDEHNKAHDDHITLIADGGVKFVGDIVKAIGAGADSVMSGYLFAGTDCTPGNIVRKGIFPNEKAYKVYRGSASRESKLDRGENNNVEGVSMEIPYRGSTQRIFKEAADGIRSGLSYAGFSSLKEAKGNLDFVRVSQASIIEAFPNGLYQRG